MTLRQLLGWIGITSILMAALSLWPYIGAHAYDPAVDVLDAGTLATYATEIFVQTDAVGPGATLVAWAGVGLVALAAVWPWVPVARPRGEANTS